MLKSTQNQQNANILQESSKNPLKADFLPIKCFVIYELYNISENNKKVSEKFDPKFYREYTKNVWDEIASKNTIINLIKENKNNLSRLRSQLEACYHNEARNSQVLLDDQPFTVPRKVAKEKELCMSVI